VVRQAKNRRMLQGLGWKQIE